VGADGAARVLAAAGVGAIVLVLSGPMQAGEVGTADQKCDLGAADSACEWKPKHCSRPPPAPPFAMGSDDTPYNAAVDDYNNYVREAQDYLQCLIKEGTSDANQAFPAIVKKTIDAQQHTIEANLQTAKRNLEMSRRGMGPHMPVIGPRDDMGN